MTFMYFLTVAVLARGNIKIFVHCIKNLKKCYIYKRNKLAARLFNTHNSKEITIDMTSEKCFNCDRLIEKLWAVAIQR